MHKRNPFAGPSFRFAATLLTCLMIAAMLFACASCHRTESPPDQPTGEQSGPDGPLPTLPATEKSESPSLPDADPEPVDASEWLRSVDDRKALNELTIPGTHNSGARYNFLGTSGQCQTLSIPEQLAAGARFLDIRLKLRRNEPVVVHGFVDQKLTFAEVLAGITDFMERHPTEFLLVAIKEEDDPTDSDVPFAERIEQMLTDCRFVRSDRTLPKTVGEARGKVWILSRYADATIGIPANSGWGYFSAVARGTIYVQDHYEIDSAETKKEDIRNTFAISAQRDYRLVLNYTSCYTSSGFPPANAKATARVINPWLSEQLPLTHGPLGVIVTDYLTSGLAEQILKLNFR